MERIKQLIKGLEKIGETQALGSVSPQITDFPLEQVLFLWDSDYGSFKLQVKEAFSKSWDLVEMGYRSSPPVPT